MGESLGLEVTDELLELKTRVCCLGSMVTGCQQAEAKEFFNLVVHKQRGSRCSLVSSSPPHTHMEGVHAAFCFIPHKLWGSLHGLF